MNKNKIIVSLTTIAIAMSSLIGFGITFSWIKRDFAPEFEGTNLTVETSGSLAIRMEGSPNVHSTLNLNTVLGLGDFTLKQVSNSTGKSDDFFNIEYSRDTGNAVLKYLDAADYDNDYTKMGLQNGYIESRFLITCTTGDDYSSKYLFLDASADKSYIDFGSGDDVLPDGTDVREAIRISLTVIDNAAGDSEHYLFRKTAYKRVNGVIKQPIEKFYHEGVRADVNNGVKYAHNKDVYTDAPNNQTLDTTLISQNYDVHEFSDFNGGIVDSTSVFDSSKTLFAMTGGSRWIALRIWLEGYDANTINDVAGSRINLKLTFKMNDDVNTESSS